MNYSIKSIAVFEKQAKRLSAKYPSLKSDLTLLINNLKTSPFQGTALGNNCFKIRLAISSKNKGKSGGARVITNIAVIEEIVYLLSIYDKSDKEALSIKELTDLLKYIPT